ncbi:hypothetical protein TNCT_461501 [Trichonephila clavata]|uniref:Uncharacterized protein n=1 Tax=Trichonephila clavata TaxID=2740835 RepID=A0A8X6KVF9_TRICU|nr:hypothetical protein TNCT_461501 [Trichonephila clavata]
MGLPRQHRVRCRHYFDEWRFRFLTPLKTRHAENMMHDESVGPLSPDRDVAKSKDWNASSSLLIALHSYGA